MLEQCRIFFFYDISKINCILQKIYIYIVITASTANANYFKTASNQQIMHAFSKSYPLDFICIIISRVKISGKLKKVISVQAE